MIDATQARLLAWLGPWRDGERVPVDVHREAYTLPHQQGEAWLYLPKRQAPVGRVLVAHGINPHGPADLRLDRLMRILAHSGLAACVPLLDELVGLQLGPRAPRQLAAGLSLLQGLSHGTDTRTALFSISFGIQPAARMASLEGDTGALGGLVAFGGYGDPAATLRYAMGEACPGAPEPDHLSLPAVALNLIDVLAVPAEGLKTVCAAWRELARLTWGKPEMLPQRRWEPVARQLGAAIPTASQELYLRGCGLTADARDFWLDALGKKDLTPMDPRHDLASLGIPIHLIHGVGDNVIPHSQLDVLAAALPPQARVHTYRTGLYDHTRSNAGLTHMAGAAGELRTFARMIRAVVACATARR